AHAELDPADGGPRPQIGLLALSPLGHASARADQHRFEAERASPDSRRAGHQQHSLEQAEEPEQLREDHKDADGQNRIGQQGGRPGPAWERRAPCGPAGDRHREDDCHQADHAEDVVAEAAHFLLDEDAPGSSVSPRRSAPLPQPFWSSGPLIRKTETRPEWTTSWTAGSRETQPRSGDALA